MFRLELDDREHDMLADVLRSSLSELRTEVSHTDRQAYRLRLRDEENSLRHILEKLEQPAARELGTRDEDPAAPWLGYPL